MKKIIISILTLFLILPLQAQEVKKSKLKILYVGQNPEKPDGYSFLSGGAMVETWNEVKKERANVFHEFLQQYFDKVTLVYGEDYKEGMSDKHDVTVFDALPPRPGGSSADDFIPPYPNAPKFISDEYDAATVLIGGMGGAMMVSRNIKMDWACNCLFDHAFNIVEDHPVFNTPYKVDMTKENKKYPDGIFYYYSSRNLSTEEVPMLRMQSVDHLDSYPPGVISSRYFEDSPDAEFISGGVSTKSVKGVALGRQGNFFQWGYRADPRHLTEAAKLALINAIHYIKDFKGQIPFGRNKGFDRYVELDKIYRVSDKGYAHSLKSALSSHHRKNEAKVRMLAGNERDADKYIVKMSSEFPDRTKYLKDLPKELVKKFGTDWNAYLKYYEDNVQYIGLSDTKKFSEMYIVGHGQEFDFVIDEDIQKLGIGNNDIKLLETCIAMLDDAEQATLGQKLLERYTVEKFTTSKQWRKWFMKNKDKMYFTDRGGFKWMIDQTK